MEFVQEFAALLQRNPQANEDQAFAEWLARETDKHAKLFPINNNLFALMVTVQADLSEQQREKLVSHMTTRGIRLQDYTFDQVKECMIEFFCLCSQIDLRESIVPRERPRKIIRSIRLL